MEEEYRLIILRYYYIYFKIWRNVLFAIILYIRTENYLKWHVVHANINSILLVYRNGSIVAIRAIVPYVRVNFYDTHHYNF